MAPGAVPQRRPGVSGWVPALYAIAATALAVAVRWLLDPWLGDQVPLVTLFGSVAVAVWLGGTRPALLAMVLGYAACDLLFIEPRGSLSALDRGAALVGLLAYLGSCAIIIGFGVALRRAEGHAAAEQELLRTTLASIGDGVITTDAAGRITSLNSVAESLTGWTRADAVGRPLESVFRAVNEETGEAVENPALRALRDGVVVGLANHTLLIARDGSAQPIDDSAAPIRDAAGARLGCVLVFRAIAERRAAERALARSEQELRDFFDAAPVGLHQVGPDGTVLRVNQAELDLIGYSREEYVGRPIADFHADRDVIEGILRRLRAGETLHNIPARMRCRDGSIRHVLISSNVLWEDGRFVHARCFTRDVTAQKLAEEALRGSEATAREHSIELQALYDATPVGMCLIDRDLRYVRINERLAEMNGAPAADHVGRTVRAMVPELADQVEPALLRIMATGIPMIDVEITGQTKAQPGVDRTWLESWYPHRDASGEVIGVIVTAVEISDRKRAEERLRECEELFRGLGEAVPDLVWMSDPEGQPIYQNPAWQRYTGTAPKGRVANLFALDHPDDLPSLRGAWEQARARGEPLQFEARARRHDGVYRWFVGRSVPVKDAGGRVVRWVTAMTDIDDLKRAEETLREADRRKDEFLATLAHELRNPLAPVRNSLEILKSAAGDRELAERAQTTLERQVTQLERLTDDLLDISRITRDRLELRREAVEITSVIQQAIESCRALLDASAHDLRLALPAAPILVDGDPVRLVQVFGNLLNNACKYTPQGGSIRIAAAVEGEQLVVSVRDDGEGIPPAMLSQIFEMFAQSERTLDRAQGGLGIGLTLVKRLVTLHGGSVEARSGGAGLGSEFVVRLPIAAETSPRAAREAPARPANEGSAHRILVVDDYRDSADSLSTLLEWMGHRTRVAYDGMSALEEAEDFRPELILLDIGLPQLNGYDVCRRIRSQPWGREMSVVALTGWGQAEDRRKSAEVGFDAHLVKPVDREALEQVLDSLRSRS
jgi:PAS domain S-box-containing protein